MTITLCAYPHYSGVCELKDISVCFPPRDNKNFKDSVELSLNGIYTSPFTKKNLNCILPKKEMCANICCSQRNLRRAQSALDVSLLRLLIFFFLSAICRFLVTERQKKTIISQTPSDAELLVRLPGRDRLPCVGLKERKA